MTSLRDLLRKFLGTAHGEVHDTVERQLNDQKLRIARLDNDLEARLVMERGQAKRPPKRRVGDSR